MTREELLKQLKDLQYSEECDEEETHIEADKALLAYIDNTEITEAFEAIDKWYS